MSKKSFVFEDVKALEQLCLDMGRDTGNETQAQILRESVALYQLMLETIKRGEKIFTGMSRDNATELTIEQFGVAILRAKR